VRGERIVAIYCITQDGDLKKVQAR
jgi:hypothetical protein